MNGPAPRLADRAAALVPDCERCFDASFHSGKFQRVLACDCRMGRGYCGAARFCDEASRQRIAVVQRRDRAARKRDRREARRRRLRQEFEVAPRLPDGGRFDRFSGEAAAAHDATLTQWFRHRATGVGADCGAGDRGRPVGQGSSASHTGALHFSNHAGDGPQELDRGRGGCSARGVRVRHGDVGCSSEQHVPAVSVAGTHVGCAVSVDFVVVLTGAAVCIRRRAVRPLRCVRRQHEQHPPSEQIDLRPHGPPLCRRGTHPASPEQSSRNKK